MRHGQADIHARRLVLPAIVLGVVTVTAACADGETTAAVDNGTDDTGSGAQLTVWADDR